MIVTSELFNITIIEEKEKCSVRDGGRQHNQYLEGVWQILYFTGSFRFTFPRIRMIVTSELFKTTIEERNRGVCVFEGSIFSSSRCVADSNSRLSQQLL